MKTNRSSRWGVAIWRKCKKKILKKQQNTLKELIMKISVMSHSEEKMKKNWKGTIEEIKEEKLKESVEVCNEKVLLGD